MTSLRPWCTTEIVLTDAEHRLLESLPNGNSGEVPNPLSCSVEAGHDGPHLAFGESQGAEDDEWWLSWEPSGQRELAKVAMCPQWQWPDEEGLLCELPAGHWGAHTFELASPEDVRAAASTAPPAG